MTKCGQILENKAATICGKDICCHDCDSKCDKACQTPREECEYLREETNCLVPNQEAFLEKHKDFLTEIRTFKIQFTKMEEQEKILKDKLKKAMNEFNIKEFENDAIKIILSEPTETHTIDVKRVKAELPAVAAKYMKTTMKQGTLKIEPKVIQERV